MENSSSKVSELLGVLTWTQSQALQHSGGNSDPTHEIQDANLRARITQAPRVSVVSGSIKTPTTLIISLRPTGMEA